jgi:hypothetical protein
VVVMVHDHANAKEGGRLGFHRCKHNSVPLARAEQSLTMLLQRVTNIRAIYIPIAQQASEDHPELCTFYQVNFAVANNKVKILHHSGSARKPTVTWRDVSLNKTLGLPDWWSLTVGINFNGLVELLSLPRQLRAQNAFSSGNVIMIDKDLVASPRIEHSYSDDADFDWAKVASANYGLAIQWKPSIKKQDWMENFLKNSLTVALASVRSPRSHSHSPGRPLRTLITLWTP